MTQIELLNEIGVTPLEGAGTSLSFKTLQTSSHTELTLSALCTLSLAVLSIHLLLLYIKFLYFFLPYIRLLFINLNQSKIPIDRHKNTEQPRCLSVNGEWFNKNPCLFVFYWGGGRGRGSMLIRLLSTNLKEVLSLVLMKLTRGLLVVFTLCITDFTQLQAMKKGRKRHCRKANRKSSRIFHSSSQYEGSCRQQSYLYWVLIPSRL